MSSRLINVQQNSEDKSELFREGTGRSEKRKKLISEGKERRGWSSLYSIFHQLWTPNGLAEVSSLVCHIGI